MTDILAVFNNITPQWKQHACYYFCFFSWVPTRFVLGVTEVLCSEGLSIWVLWVWRQSGIQVCTKHMHDDLKVISRYIEHIVRKSYCVMLAVFSKLSALTEALRRKLLNNQLSHFFKIMCARVYACVRKLTAQSVGRSVSHFLFFRSPPLFQRKELMQPLWASSDRIRTKKQTKKQKVQIFFSTKSYHHDH